MFYFSLRRILWCGVLAAVPSALYSADKVVLIDQESALAGGIAPGDTPGFPVTISQSGSYRLNGNLTVLDADTTAIQILADSVTLDLNGFSIIGPGGCTGPATTCPGPGRGIGVQAVRDGSAGPRAVRIENGSVRGMGSMGIQMTGSASFVEKVSVYGNAGGGMAVNGGSVTQSAATQNGSFGIIASTVRDCTSSENLGDGIILDGSTGGIATGNISSFNGGYGIFAPFSTATGNTMFLNKSFGISAFCPSSIVSNTIVASDTATIETRGAGCVLANNATRP